MSDKEKKVLTDAIRNDAKMREMVERLDAGYGTYDEVNDIAKGLGNVIGNRLANAYDEETFREYMYSGHDVITTLSEVAQQNLNDAAKIGLKPMLTRVPKAQIENLIRVLADTAAELLPERIRNVSPTMMMKMVDDITKYNLDFQRKSGLKPIIRRTWSGSYSDHDTKHTDWCHDLEGEWEYGQEPKEVYVRHEGCQCKVEFFPSRTAEGRITALSKGEIDREGVLWNTREDTLGDRLWRAERSKQRQASKKKK